MHFKSDLLQNVFLMQVRVFICRVQINDWEEKMVQQGHRDVVRSESLIEPLEGKPRKNSRNTQ